MRIAKFLPLAAFAIAPFLRADDAPARRLGAPRVMKLDWSIGSPCAADIDGDGRTDLALLNNDTARIEILLRLKPGEKPPAPVTLRPNRWNPLTDDAPYRRLSVAGSVAMISLAVTDLDGSKRVSLAFTGARDALTVVSRDAAGEWTVRRTYDKREALNQSGSLCAADIDGDGSNRLLMLSKDGLLVFPKLGPTGAIPEPALYRTGGEKPSMLSVADIDGDKRPDIAYLTRGEKPELRVRFGLGGSVFGPERVFSASLTGADFSKKIPARDGATGFIGVSYTRRVAEVFTIRPDKKPFFEAREVSPAFYSPASALKSSALAAFSDDGATMLVGDAKAAAVQVYRRAGVAGYGEPESFPSVDNLSALATGDFDGKGLSLLTLGATGTPLGLAAFDEKGRLGFPADIDTHGDPLAITVAKTGGITVAYAISKDKKDSKKISLVTLAGDGKGSLKIISEHEIGADAKDAEGLIAGDIGGKPALLVTRGRSVAMLLRETRNDKGETALTETAKDSSVLKAALTGVKPADIAFGDIGDGKSSLLVASAGHVRAYGFNDAGDFVVKDQFNTRRAGDRPLCPAVLTAPGEKKPGLLYFNATDNGLEWLAPDEKGVFRHKTTIGVGALDPQSVRVFGDRLMYVGRDTVSEVSTTEVGPAFAALERFETDLPDVVHLIAHTGNITGGKTPDLILIDPHKHHLELVRRDETGVRKNTMNFSLYSINVNRIRNGNTYEPREHLVTDLDGDGGDDLVLVMHDRVLIYPSEPASK